MAQKKWNDLSDAEKENQIFDALLLNEVGEVEPLFCTSYQNAKANTQDVADRMRLDISFSYKVSDLRQQKRISSAQRLRQIAKSMVHMSSDQMLETMNKHEIVVDENEGS